MNKEQLQKEIESYNLTERLTTHPYIFCTKTGEKTTMFGSNLKNRIKKFGSLETLLLTFVCRKSQQADKPAKPIKEKKQKKKTIQERIEEIKISIPKIDLSKGRETIILNNNPEFAAEVTKNGCWRPDIYLNSDKYCDYCSLYKVCKASARRVSSYGWQLEEAITNR